MTNSMDLDVPRMVRDFLSELMNAASPELPTSDHDWYEIEYGEEIELDRIERMISIQRFDGDVEHNAAKLLNEFDLTMDQIPVVQRRQLLDGVARAQREAIHYQRHVRTQPFSTYSYYDRDLASVDLKLASIGLQDVKPTASKVSLSSFVETYLNSDAHGWTEATRKEKQRLFRKINSKGEVGNYYSKKIGRYLSAIGLSDPRLVAHSFRHGFKTALRNAAVPEGEQHFLMGHEPSFCVERNILTAAFARIGEVATDHHGVILSRSLTSNPHVGADIAPHP